MFATEKTGLKYMIVMTFGMLSQHYLYLITGFIKDIYSTRRGREEKERVAEGREKEVVKRREKGHSIQDPPP
jgi:hypothetical protein